MIILKDICKNYNEKVVLDHVNLTFKKGKISCILGYSGVGKTTLLNVIANLEDSSGEIVGLDGAISYAFQTPCLIDNMTVIDNILFACSKVSKDEIDECLTRLEIQNLKNSLAKNLSVGEKQRVNFLRALLYFPNVLILDETFSSLDVKSKLLCEKLLLEYKNKYNFTTIIVTHDYSLALSLADDIIILSNNKTQTISLEKDDNGNNLLTESQLKERLYLAFNV